MVIIVIQDYLNDVKKCMELFTKKIGNKHPIKAWRDKTIPKSGQLSEDTIYDFHGVGCMVEFPNYCIDFDFGKDGQSNGFDTWRIASYIEERISDYSYYNELLYEYIDDTSLVYKIIDVIEEEFQKYIDNGTFYKIDKLFYLSENGENLKQNLSKLNLEQISINDIEYKLFLEKIDALYPQSSIQMYRKDIILFFHTKKSDNIPLALVLNLKGEELFSIPFPTSEDSECVNQNIAFYGGKIDNKKSILEIVFVNGNCWLEFWCRYDLEKKKYIDSGLRK